MANAIVLAIVAACVFLAVRAIRRNHLLTSCGGDCAGCAMRCGKKRRAR